jgi:hypothetical protein
MAAIGFGGRRYFTGTDSWVGGKVLRDVIQTKTRDEIERINLTRA